MVHFDAPGRAIHVRAPLDDSGLEGIMLASYTMESAECVRLVPDVPAGFRLTLCLKNGIVLELGPSKTQAIGSRLARRVAGVTGCTVDIPTGSAGTHVPDPRGIPAEPVFAALIEEFRRKPSVDRPAARRPVRSSHDGAAANRTSENANTRRPVRSSRDGAAAERTSENANEPVRDDRVALLQRLVLASVRLPVATRSMAEP